MTTDQLKRHIDMRLDKIEAQLRNLTALIDSMHDDATLVQELHEKLAATNNAMRELQYERWFENNKKKSDGKTAIHQE